MVDMNGKPVPFVLFKVEAPGLNLYITEKGLTYVFLEAEKGERDIKTDKLIRLKEKKQKKTRWTRIDMELPGAVIRRENIVPEGEASGSSRYFLPHCPDGIRNVRSYEKITVKNIYRGIDWVFYNSNENGFKYDFMVHPGADPGMIQLLYRSEEKLFIDGEGNIQINTPLGDLTENAPVSFLKNTSVSSRFDLVSQEENNLGGYDNRIGFDLVLPTAGKEEVLRIDPQLSWATFYGGGSHADGPMDVTTDNAGNIFIAGYTGSTDFPVQTAGGNFFQGTHGGGIASAPWDAFVLKFNAGGVLQWATYYGGALYDEARAITTDAAGNVFVTGLTESSDFPVQNSGTFFQANNGGGYDVFVLKFDNAGNRLWATYYGGNSSNNADMGNGIAADASGNVFVTGSASPNFPVQTAGTFYQGTAGGGFGGDAFILKFDNSGNRLWATYYGGNGNDKANSLVIDAAGNVYVAGMTAALNFPTQTAGTFFQAANAGGNSDAFILKFSNTGVRLWATYYGGGGDDEFWGLDVDGSGNLFTSGSTTSANFPVQNTGTFYQGTFGGGWLDAVIVKFDNAGNRLWGTYYGGTLNELVESPGNLAVDSCGTVYMGFYTDPNNTLTPLAPCDGGYFDNTFNGGLYDDYIVQFSNTGVLLWATYLGGNGYDFRAAMTVDNAGSLFVTGEWSNLSAGGMNSGTYPLTNPGGGAYFNSYSGGSDDGFVVKFSKIPLVLTPAGINATCGCNGTASVTASGGCVPYNYLWSNGQTTQSVSNLCAGTYSVTVADAGCSLQTTTVTISAGAGAITATYTVTPATCSNSNGSSAVTPSGGTSPYTYFWSPSGGTGSTATGLAGGSYTVTVSDASGCTVPVTVSVTTTGGFTTSSASAPSSCLNANGSATVTPTGGSTPYSYSWSPSGGNSSTATGLSAGNYSVTITDASGCTGVETVSVATVGGGTVNITSQINVLCNGDSTGSATAAMSGGSSPFTYVWSHGLTAAGAVNLPAGNYTVTVTDANGCTSSQSVTITQASALTATATATSASCGNNDGTATVSSAGGSPSYSYVWSNTQTGSSISNLLPGNYSVTVTDGNGCTQTTAVSVAQTGGPAATIGTNITISQGSSATLSASGGTTYSWTPTSDLSCTTCANPVASPSTTTQYCVYVYDASGCYDSACVTVTVTTFIEPPDCSGATTKDIFLPNAFSPNGDSENEDICLQGKVDCIEEFTIRIYNRWGEEVYGSDNKYFCWDGRYQDKPENTGVYVYVMQVKMSAGDELSKKGNISLIR